MQGVADFLYQYFHSYDITTEIVMLILTAILYTVIAFSKPDRTYMFTIFFCGLSFAAAIMITHVCLLGETIIMRETHDQTRFNIIYIIYSILYTSELNFIFIYQTQLSYKRRSQRKQITVMALIFAIAWNILMFMPLIRGNLLIFEDGKYVFTGNSTVNVLCSLLCGIVAIGITIANRKDVSRIVYWGSIIFVPVEMIGILAQFFFPTAYFICATYTLPFVIYYLLFHVNKYDEVSGCQTYESHRTLLNKYIKYKKTFIMISIEVPKLEARNRLEIEGIKVFATNLLCREFEKLDPRVRIYQITPFRYNLVCKMRHESGFEHFKNQVLQILQQPVEFEGKMFTTPMNILISRNYDSIENVDEYVALLNMKRKMFENVDINQILYVTKEDVKKYKQDAFVEKNLFDINIKNDLDDDRVLVYVQPILDVKTNTFRTGEALMRLQIDGKMIFPDQFIPIAEDIGCIHTFTRIMLHKVAQKTVELSKQYDFDAFTVNVSTVELTDPKVGKEFLQIITEVGADPTKIRLEITESTTLTDYDAIISNINYLNDKGVKFYLDDFGTGYSNMERTISIPFMTIKFDKSILYKALSDKKSEELFFLLVKFFKANGFSTVVEGVEDENMVNYVKNAGVDFIQGYVYSKPIPADEVATFYHAKE